MVFKCANCENEMPIPLPIVIKALNKGKAVMECESCNTLNPIRSDDGERIYVSKMGGNMNKQLQKIADHYGKDTQAAQCAEELCELSCAILQYRKRKGRKELGKVMEETADMR